MEQNLLHILLAEDSEGDRLLFKEALEELNLDTRVDVVKNGVQLMDYLTKNNTLPHLLFLDLNMPRKSGMECLKEIRSDNKLKEIAIAVYSTSASEHDINESFLNGANVYINKPNDFKTLKQLIGKVVTATLLSRDPRFNRENFLLRV
jgi:CheY-like chemotaxis protein